MNLLKSSRGLSLVSILILTAIAVAVLNAYAYFNPDFQLRKYSIVYFLGTRNDEVRKADLAKIQDAIEQYYNDHDSYPGFDGWCGRIFSVLKPDVKDEISPYFPDKGIPQDPSFRGTNKDYFYRREDRDTYILMAVMENPSKVAEEQDLNFEGCHDWPGNNVYNYQIVVSR